MSCLVCHEPRELSGAACAECLEELKPAITITPEQVRMRGGMPTTAVLVDAWGRVHPLRRRTVVGRVLDEDGLMILDGSISRRHAVLELRGDTWVVHDFGSSNGTCIEDERIEGERQLRDGECVRFGDVKFFFLDGITAPPEIDTSSLRALTWRIPRPFAPPSNAVKIVLVEPVGGGGGVAVIDGKQVQLTLPQFELIGLLHERAHNGSGFVGVAELVRRLSLDSAQPNEDHVRHLVRRLRRVLFKAGIDGLIESRYGSGYRLSLLRA